MPPACFINAPTPYGGCGVSGAGRDLRTVRRPVPTKGRDWGNPPGGFAATPPLQGGQGAAGKSVRSVGCGGNEMVLSLSQLR